MKLIGENITVRYAKRLGDDGALRDGPPDDGTLPPDDKATAVHSATAVHTDATAQTPQAVFLLPTSLFWRGSLYRVQAIESTWRWRGAWWTTPSLLGQERTYYRVRCAPPSGSDVNMELYLERGRWTLSRLLD